LDWPTAVSLELDVLELDVLELDVLPEEDLLVDGLLVVVFADSAGSSPRAIWTASPPVSASAAAAAAAVIFAVSAMGDERRRRAGFVGGCSVMARTVARLPQRNLGSG
jgi:hypothetical protein